MSQRRAKVELIIAMVIFGTIGLIRRFVDMPSGALSLSRGVLGTIALLLIMKLRGGSLAKEEIKKHLPLLILTGIVMGTNWTFLHEGYRYTTVAKAVLCYNMTPILIILVSPLFLHEKMTAKKATCAAIAMCGMVFISGVLGGTGHGVNDMKGVLLSLCAAVCNTALYILNRKTGEVPGYDRTILQLAVASIVLIPYTFLVEDVSEVHLTPVSVILVITLAVVHSGICYAIYFTTMSYLSTMTVSLFCYIEPIVAVMLSAFVLHERLGVMEIIGAVLILGATLISELDLPIAAKHGGE